MRSNHICLTLLALRDFFIAKNAIELSEAYHSLSQDDTSAPYDIDWTETEYAFNRLFIGPTPPIAPLYASCYLEKESRLMGKSTIQMRELIHDMGLGIPESLSVPDDHLSLELEVWARLECLMDDNNSQEFTDTIKQARRWLICEHMALWIPEFVQRASKVNNFAINYAMSFLEKCVVDAKASIEQ